MIGGRIFGRLILIAGCSAATVTGCAFDGVNSLSLPGAVGREPGAVVYHVEIANVATLERNSPVMISDVVVGSVGKMTFTNWHVDVEVSVRPDVVVPANAVATIGQTSLLGSMHLELNPPLGESPGGRLAPGATIPLNKSSTYPSTEQTLASLAALVNRGGLGQIGDIIHNANAALSGREDQVRHLLTQLDVFVGALNDQRYNIAAAIEALDRLSAHLAGQSHIITRALREIPPALDVLIRERPRITTALDKLGEFSDTATRLVNDTQADLVKNLQNLEPTIRALADVGPDLAAVLAYATHFPYTQDQINRAVRGDFLNLFVTLDMTYPRLKRTLFLGTRWGQEGAALIPAPGDPYYLEYSYNPLGSPIAAPPEAAPPGGAPRPTGALPPMAVPPLPVAPPPTAADTPPPSPDVPAPIFAGPYAAPTPTPVVPPGGG